MEEIRGMKKNSEGKKGVVNFFSFCLKVSLVTLLLSHYTNEVLLIIIFKFNEINAALRFPNNSGYIYYAYNNSILLPSLVNKNKE